MILVRALSATGCWCRFTTPFWQSIASSRSNVFGSPLRIRCLPAARSQESIHNLAVQGLDIDVFLFQPAAEIGNDYDLLPDRVVSIALFGNSHRIGIEVFIQRPLAKPFNRA
jgi:hypothetical protein